MNCLNGLFLALCATGGLYGACVTKEVAKKETMSEATSAEAVCSRLTAALEISAKETDALMKVRLGKTAGVQITKTRCNGRAMVAELYMAAMVDGDYREQIMVIGLHINDSGEIEANFLGSKDASEE